MTNASVIIPTYGDWEGLGACLAALSAQDIDPARFEIVVGNNNGEPDVPEELVLPSNARVVWEPKPGSYSARNAAVAESRGQVLFFTDADCVPASDWVSRGLQLLEDDPGVDRLAGRIQLTPAGDRWQIAELYDRLFNLRQARYVKRGYAATANLVVRRSLFERVGPFNDSLYSSGDKEWNRRAGKLDSGLRYCPDLVIEHGARASFEEHAKKRARVTKGRFLMKGEKRRPSLWSKLRHRLPSLSAAKVILRAPGLSMAERAGLWRLERRLERVEHETLRQLIRGEAAEHR